MKSYSIIFAFLFISFPLYSQVDTLVYTNGTIELGEVIKITESTVDFKMQSTEVIYEILKARIKEIRLKNGRIIEFSPYQEEQEKKYDTWDGDRTHDADRGTDTCWIVGGTVGIVLAILLIIGALAQ